MPSWLGYETWEGGMSLGKGLGMPDKGGSGTLVECHAQDE